MKTCSCPNCRANLNIDRDDIEYVFCQYCGTQIMMTDYRMTQHIIDEAMIRQAENERIHAEISKMTLLRQIELEDRHIAEYERKKKIKSGVIAGLLLLGLMFCLNRFYLALVFWILVPIVWNIDIGNEIGAIIMIRCPLNVADFKRKDFSVAQSAFEGAGFTNVKCIPLNDLTFGLFKKPGSIASISINGKKPFPGKKYPRESSIVITYHSMSE